MPTPITLTAPRFRGDFVKVYRELIDSKGVPSHRGTILALKLKASRTDRGPALHDGFQIAHYAGLIFMTVPGGS